MTDSRDALFGNYKQNARKVNFPRTCKLFIGEDDMAASDLQAVWDSTRIMVHAEFKLDLLPTYGSTIGSRGELIEWQRPPIVPLQMTWSLYDYDQEIIQKLMDWQAAPCTPVRFFVWGRFALRCMIASVPLDGPFGKTLDITTRNRTLWVYGDGPAPAWDGTGMQDSLNNPFLQTGSNGTLYGGSVP